MHATSPRFNYINFSLINLWNVFVNSKTVISLIKEKLEYKQPIKQAVDRESKGVFCFKTFYF